MGWVSHSPLLARKMAEARVSCGEADYRRSLVSFSDCQASQVPTHSPNAGDFTSVLMM